MKKLTLSSLLVLPLVFVSSCASTTAADPTTANHNAAIYSTQATCTQAIATPIAKDYSAFLADDDITLLSWNIEKGKNAGWKAELANLAQDTQLVLLQEAILIDEMKENLDETFFWSYSPGYQTEKYSSGIMTLSGVQPDLICSLKKIEPWLRTPKIASITRFQLQASEQPLLLVNIHQINFTLGTKAFSKQLEEVFEVLKAHKGPIILSGDFNTWSQSRLQGLSQMANELALSPANFSPDHRKQTFGYYLDHIFTRGFKVKESHTVQVDTSDHNPLRITLSLEETS